MVDLQSRIDAFLLREIALGTFPSASYAIGTVEGIMVEGAHGLAVAVPVRVPATLETIYDCASITKPLITTPLALRCVAAGLFGLDDRVADHVEELRGGGKERITFRHLLTHSSGFQSWWCFYAFGHDAESYLETVVDRPLEYETGTRVIYSDVGIALLLLAIQRVRGRNGIELAREQVLALLGLESATFNPLPALKPRIAATEWGQRFEAKLALDRGIDFDGFRTGLMWGELNDGNSWGMGGYAGTAGLFATARDVFQLALPWLDGKERLLANDLIAEATRNHTPGLDESRGLGWQIADASNVGSPLSAHSFGHNGFTGTSVYVDRARGVIAVLATNRIHPSATTTGMQNARREFHRIVAESAGI
jgi:CubicO group peptidase (beta-lactamase class C family)